MEEATKKPFAEINDLADLWRQLTGEELEQAKKLLNIVSSELRVRAKFCGKDLDKMVEDEDFANVAKSVTVDVVKRYFNDNQDGISMSQMSQSAGGYTVSGTYLVPGGGLFIKKSELARLGLRRARYGVIDIYGSD